MIPNYLIMQPMPSSLQVIRNQVRIKNQLTIEDA